MFRLCRKSEYYFVFEVRKHETGTGYGGINGIYNLKYRMFFWIPKVVINILRKLK